jgi:hypothetical protein
LRWASSGLADRPQCPRHPAAEEVSSVSQLLPPGCHIPTLAGNAVLTGVRCSIRWISPGISQLQLTLIRLDTARKVVRRRKTPVQEYELPVKANEGQSSLNPGPVEMTHIPPNTTASLPFDYTLPRSFPARGLRRWTVWVWFCAQSRETHSLRHLEWLDCESLGTQPAQPETNLDARTKKTPSCVSSIMVVLQR